MRMSAKCGQGSGDQVHTDARSRCCSKDFTYVCVQKRRAHLLFTESVTNHAQSVGHNQHMYKFLYSISILLVFILLLFFLCLILYYFSLKCLIYIPLRLLFLHSLLVKFPPLTSTPFTSKVRCSWFPFFTDQHGFSDLPGSFHSTSEARSLLQLSTIIYSPFMYYNGSRRGEKPQAGNSLHEYLHPIQ